MLVRLFGIAEVEGNESASGLGGPQQRAILGLLVSRLGRPIDQDWIQEQLWPDRASGEMSATLNPYLTGLRRALGSDVFPRASGRPARYQLLLARDEVDILRFEDQSAKALALAETDLVAAIPLLRDARELWRGRPFEDMQEAPELSARAVSLDLIHQQVCECWVRALMATARHGEALVELERLQSEEPYHEPFWSMRVNTLLLMGRRRDARLVLAEARAELGDLPLELQAAATSLDTREPEPTKADALRERPEVGTAGGQVDWARLRQVVVGRVSEPEPPGLELVGRIDDLDQVREVVGMVAGGTSAVVVVAGEAGIGKTRFLNETARVVESVGGRAHWGRCFEHDKAVPHRPLVNCLRSLIADLSSDESAAMLGPSVADLAPLLPELADALGADALELSTEERHTRLLDGSTEFVRRVAERAPVALIVDDMQWADEATIGLLVHLIHHLGGRTLVAIAYRPEEVADDHPIHRCLAQMPRERPVSRHQLSGLASDEVAALVRLCTDGSPVGSADRLAEITGGNPFFVKELAQHGGGLHTNGLPLGITELIGHRLRRLTLPARDLLRFVAVSARGCRVETLREVGDGTRDPLDVIDECTAAGLVRLSADAGGHVVEPVHALIAEAVVLEMNELRRALLHQQLAEALEGLAESDHERWINDLAFHWHGAGRSGRAERAAEMCVEAARLASQRTAFVAEAAWLERALEARSWMRSDDPVTLSELHISTAVAHHRAGDPGARQSRADRAYDLATSVPDGELMAEAALVFGGARGTYGLPSDRTIELLRGALVATSTVPVTNTSGTGDGDGDHSGFEHADAKRIDAIRCRALSRLAQEEYHQGEFETARRTSEASRSIAESLDDPRAMFAALEGACWVANHPHGLDERERLAGRMSEMAAEFDDPEATMSALIWTATAQLERGRIDLVRDATEELERLGAQREIPSLQFRTSTLRTTLTMLEGRFDEGMALAQATHGLGSRIEPGNADQVLQAQMIMPLREQGLLASVLPMVREMMQGYESVPGWACAYALVLAESGERDEAVELLGRLAGDHDPIPFDMAWLQAQSYLADVAVMCADSAAAEVLRTRLMPFADRNVSLWDIGSSGAMTHQLGLLEATLGNRDQAADLLATAVVFNERSGHVVAAIGSQCELARLTSDGALAARTKIAADTLGLLRISALCEQLQQPA